MPNSKPALDVPIIFPYAPNAVLIGFFVSFIVGTISMLAMVGLNTTVIIPGVVGHFSVVPRRVLEIPQGTSRSDFRARLMAY